MVIAMDQVLVHLPVFFFSFIAVVSARTGTSGNDTYDSYKTKQNSRVQNFNVAR